MVKVTEKKWKLIGTDNRTPLLVTNNLVNAVDLKRKVSIQPEEASQLAMKKPAPIP